MKWEIIEENWNKIKYLNEVKNDNSDDWVDKDLETRIKFDHDLPLKSSNSV